MSSELKIHTADATELTMEVAGLGSRSYAFIIDWHIRFLFAIVWLLLAWLLISADGGVDVLSALVEDENSLQSSRVLITLLPALAIYFLYHPILETTMQGRTPGKRMAGVRLVDTQGQTPGVAALLIRNVFRLVDGLPAFYAVGCVACMVTGRSVRIGDLAAGTLMVHEETLSATALERAQRVADNQKLTPADQEILLDLVDRWKALDQNIRTRLAQRFLEKLGEQVPVAVDNRTLSQALFLKLQQLAGDAAP
jgi:uncharacterized RDD family membrane protein YckC